MLFLSIGTCRRGKWRKGKGEGDEKGKEALRCGRHRDLQMTFTGEGTASEGILPQKADFNVGAADFIVEKTYVSSGDEVKRGDALYQIREESISEAEAALSEAQEKINVYQANLDQNQYYADANISEKKEGFI